MTHLQPEIDGMRELLAKKTAEVVALQQSNGNLRMLRDMLCIKCKELEDRIAILEAKLKAHDEQAKQVNLFQSMMAPDVDTVN